MSRLIDADALFREMEKAQWYNNADRDEIAEELVLNAPTIEPECKKGEWEMVSQHENPPTYIYSCSECRHKSFGFYNYCPNCGADMREPEDIPMEYFESGGR